MGREEDIRKTEAELSKTPYNKANEHHIGMLKAKLARLKEKGESKTARGKGYSVKKTGDATILLVGFPSVGKSTILNKLTSAQSKTAEYDFTTLDVIPGILLYKGAKLQILDIPGVIEGGASGKGMGKAVFSVVRNADLILIIIAGDNAEGQYAVIVNELSHAGFRLNRKKPDIKIYKKNRGGIKVDSTLKLTKLSPKTIESVLKEFSIYNAQVLIREDASVDDLIDVITGSSIYVPALPVLNKIDILSQKRVEELEVKLGCIPISASEGINLDTLKGVLWSRLGLIRIYLKRLGQEPDMRQPLIIKKGASIDDVCQKIHSKGGWKYARLWGSGKFRGQKIGLKHTLQDSDIVELHSR